MSRAELGPGGKRRKDLEEFNHAIVTHLPRLNSFLVSKGHGVGETTVVTTVLKIKNESSLWKLRIN